MQFSPWLLVLALSSPLALAQHQDPTRMYPITVPIRDAGVLNLETGRWQRAMTGANQGSTLVYNNTCNSSSGSFYYGMEHCEEVYGSGRIPSPSDPGAPAGATDDNMIDSYSICYCTPFATGQVDIQIGFIEQAAGCTNPQGKAPTGSELAYFDLSGTGLPGDNAGGGNLSCWTVTLNVANGGFCMMSDGDSVWDNSASDDNFNWIFSHDMNQAAFGIASGPCIAGNPSVSTFGGCSYTVACGSDPITAAPCGTGLAVADQFWLNADNHGGAVYPPASCPLAASMGSSCYSFGGWPMNNYSNFYLQMTSSGPCCPVASGATGYCTAAQGNSSTGCFAQIYSTCANPVPGANDCAVELQLANSRVPSLLVYSVSGRATVPFGTGQLCLQAPLSKGKVFGTGGSLPCCGTGSVPINDPGTIDFPSGTTAQFQFLILVPGSPFVMDLSDAIELVY